jgi:hypothetical protein
MSGSTSSRTSHALSAYNSPRRGNREASVTGAIYAADRRWARSERRGAAVKGRRQSRPGGPTIRGRAIATWLRDGGDPHAAACALPLRHEARPQYLLSASLCSGVSGARWLGAGLALRSQLGGDRPVGCDHRNHLGLGCLPSSAWSIPLPSCPPRGSNGRKRSNTPPALPSRRWLEERSPAPSVWRGLPCAAAEPLNPIRRPKVASQFATIRGKMIELTRPALSFTSTLI